jgi:hypothetical protein
MKITNHEPAGPVNDQTPAPVHKEIWLDKQDVLSRMHISERTLQNWRRKGVLPYYKIGGKIYYKESELNSMVQKAKV